VLSNFVSGRSCRQETLTERAERNEANAEFLKRRHDRLFWFSPEHDIRSQGGNGLATVARRIVFALASESRSALPSLWISSFTAPATSSIGS